MTVAKLLAVQPGYNFCRKLFPSAFIPFTLYPKTPKPSTAILLKNAPLPILYNILIIITPELSLVKCFMINYATYFLLLLIYAADADRIPA